MSDMTVLMLTKPENTNRTHESKQTSRGDKMFERKAKKKKKTVRKKTQRQREKREGERLACRWEEAR